MKHDDNTTSRAEMLAKLAAAPILIGALAALQAEAEAGTIPPKSVQYTDKSTHKGQVCDGCKFYVPAKKNPKTAKGTCQQVSGPIAPGGWCVMWQKK